jgi:hypothetical protein
MLQLTWLAENGYEVYVHDCTTEESESDAGVRDAMLLEVCGNQ